MKFSPRVATALVASLAIAGFARAADERLESAEKCGRIAVDAERLECFDGIFGARDEAAPAAAAVAAAPAAAPEPAATSAAAKEAEFGLTEAQKQAAMPQSAQEAEPEVLTSRVARVIPRGMEPSVLELENGQQWRLLESMANVRFRAGDAIVIRRGSLGSYLASMPNRNGAWRVRRVR